MHRPPRLVWQARLSLLATLTFHNTAPPLQHPFARELRLVAGNLTRDASLKKLLRDWTTTLRRSSLDGRLRSCRRASCSPHCRHLPPRCPTSLRGCPRFVVQREADIVTAFRREVAHIDGSHTADGISRLDSTRPLETLSNQYRANISGTSIHYGCPGSSKRDHTDNIYRASMKPTDNIQPANPLFIENIFVTIGRRCIVRVACTLEAGYGGYPEKLDVKFRVSRFSPRSPLFSVLVFRWSSIITSFNRVNNDFTGNASVHPECESSVSPNCTTLLGAESLAPSTGERETAAASVGTPRPRQPDIADRATRVRVSEHIWAAHNSEVLRTNEGDSGEYGAALELRGVGNGSSPTKTHRPASPSGTIPSCENPGVTRPGIKLGFSLMGGEQGNRSATAIPEAGVAAECVANYPRPRVDFLTSFHACSIGFVPGESARCWFRPTPISRGGNSIEMTAGWCHHNKHSGSTT
ncbi:hypothetical protein PR048_029019 [Dryococelus australis]|uniref:Uncharacterized protein n=1 Tax=Dryococelus australis TaxID=614101 RepID=A0ABQ9GC82_9NEOP|nr:hypothetical protein PR048_029019 [Dryococelus australis]